MVNTKDTEKRQNLILVGIKGKPQIDEEKYEQYQKYLLMQIEEYETNKKIVTDDYAPIGN